MSIVITNRIMYLIVVMVCIEFVNVYYFNKLYAPTIRAVVLNPVINTNLINWNLVLLDMLRSVSFFKKDIIFNSFLLVNIIKNNTHHVLQTIKITNILIQLVSENVQEYHVISMEQLYQTYRKLEIFPENSFNTYSISVEIANYLKADYIIYGIIYMNSEKLYVELQLIFVRTGEILKVISKFI